MRDGATKGTFPARGSKAEVIGESRTIPIEHEAFEDEFAPFAVHLYRIRSSD